MSMEASSSYLLLFLAPENVAYYSFFSSSHKQSLLPQLVNPSLPSNTTSLLSPQTGLSLRVLRSLQKQRVAYQLARQGCPTLVSTDMYMVPAAEGVRKTDNNSCELWFFRTGQGTLRIQECLLRCTLIVSMVACGFSSIVRMCSSLAAFVARSDSPPVMEAATPSVGRSFLRQNLYYTRLTWLLKCVSL